MRTVVTNWEVGQKWYEQKQEYAVNGGRTFSFNGRRLYSYNTCIGYICTNGTALLSENTYSNTTSQHLDTVRQGSYFNVPELGETTEAHKANIKYYLGAMKQEVLNFSNAKSRAAQRFVNRNNMLFSKLKQYCETFGLDIPITLGLWLNPEYPFVKEFFKTRFYYPNPDNKWRGVFIPKWLAKKGMENAVSKDILKTRNTEIRREIIRIVGIERVCYDLGAKVIDRAGDYELVALDLQDGRYRPFLKMHNPSVPEIWHVEGVHPCIKTVQDAINYRRYGDEMLEERKPNENEIVEIEDRLKERWLYIPNRESWRWNAEVSFWQSLPENQQIRAEYRTTEMFGNELDWKPEELT